MAIEFLKKLQFLFQPATLKIVYGGRGECLVASGIYIIYNRLNSKYYLGCATNLAKRKNVHFSQLNNKIHYNKHLQNAWNKYGGLWNFEFIILEYCSLDILLKREQWWLDITQCWKHDVGYNLSPTASSQLGIKRSEETLKKMSLAVTGTTRIFTEKHKQNLSIASKGRKKSEAHAKIIAENNIKRKRDFEKWPHEKGNKCKCDECKMKKKNYLANWRANRDSKLWAN